MSSKLSKTSYKRFCKLKKKKNNNNILHVLCVSSLDVSRSAYFLEEDDLISNVCSTFFLNFLNLRYLHIIYVFTNIFSVQVDAIYFGLLNTSRVRYFYIYCFYWILPRVVIRLTAAVKRSLQFTVILLTKYNGCQCIIIVNIIVLVKVFRKFKTTAMSTASYCSVVFVAWQIVRGSVVWRIRSMFF